MYLGLQLTSDAAPDVCVGATEPEGPATTVCVVLAPASVRGWPWGSTRGSVLVVCVSIRVCVMGHFWVSSPVQSISGYYVCYFLYTHLLRIYSLGFSLFTEAAPLRVFYLGHQVYHTNYLILN